MAFAEQEELADNCVHSDTTVNGVKGVRLTSNKNHKSIFLPYTGSRYGTSVGSQGNEGDYWSGMTETGYPGWACYLEVVRASAIAGSDNYRYEGRSVRPVIK